MNIKFIGKCLTLALCATGFLTSCGDGDNDGPTPPTSDYNKIEVEYSVSLSQAYYDYWDVQLTYTTISGEPKTISLTEDWEMEYKLNTNDEVPTTYVLKLEAVPKANAPTPAADQTYQLDKSCYLSISGEKKDGTDTFLGGMVIPSKSAMSTKGSKIAELMSSTRNLGEYSYTIEL